MLNGCFTIIKSDNEYKLSNSDNIYLPPATMGKPYHQIIHIYGSIPRSIWPGIYTKDSGLKTRILWSDPNKKVVSNRGDIVEISGIPKKREGHETDKSYIYTGIVAYGHQGKFDNDERADKDYVIELLPEKPNQSSPASSSNK